MSETGRTAKIYINNGRTCYSCFSDHDHEREGGGVNQRKKKKKKKKRKEKGKEEEKTFSVVNAI